MADIQKILDDIKELKLLEVAELVKLMEEEFGVSAAAPVACNRNSEISKGYNTVLR